MSGDDQDESQKTEDPSHKRLEDAFKKGQVATSREVSSFFILLSLTFLITVLLPGIMESVEYRLSRYIEMPEDIDLDSPTFLIEMQDLMSDMLLIMIVPALMAVAAVFAASLIQNPFSISADPLAPKLSKISPIKGFTKIFSRKNFVEFLKGLLKIIIVGAIVVSMIRPTMPHMMLLPDEDMQNLLAFILQVSTDIMIAVCAVVFLIAIADYMYQRFEFLKNLRMSKQDQKDEYKQQEGDPLIKQRIRQLRRDRAQKRMMENVPNADVVITNPTHYAIALKYDQATMRAPHVIAKGVDKVALRIREVAEANKVYIMRNPALTRLLYDHAEIDEEIPLTYYKAVAEVIGYVYKLKGINLKKS